MCMMLCMGLMLSVPRIWIVDMDTKYEGEEDELYDKAALILDFSRKKKLSQQRC